MPGFAQQLITILTFDQNPMVAGLSGMGLEVLQFLGINTVLSD